MRRADSRVRTPEPIPEAQPSDLGVRCASTSGGDCAPIPDSSTAGTATPATDSATTAWNGPEPTTNAEATDEPGQPWLTTGRRLIEMMVMGRSPGAEADQLKEQGSRDVKDGITRITDETGVPAGRWLILVHGVKDDPIGKLYLDAHTVAKQYTDLKLARVNYMREWKTCTRWMVFRSPVMLIQDNDGVRFLQHYHVADLDNVLKSGRWKDIPVWSGSFAPGGSLYVHVWIF